MSDHLIRPQPGRITMQVTPESAGWSTLDFAVVTLEPGGTHTHATSDREVALTALSGSGTVTVGETAWNLARTGVFAQGASVAYAPPGAEMSVDAGPEGMMFALGGAPAEGRYPARVFRRGDYLSEVRGGGAAQRQVNHILAHPLPAERLILYEVYVPRGTWSGWAPHCHDGHHGSPYLEETYYFRLDQEGFAMHRNWSEETDFDEVLVAHDGDCVLVTQGFHSSVASPGSNMYFLNYLAGELRDEARATPPYFHPDHTWIHDDWSRAQMSLPVSP